MVKALVTSTRQPIDQLSASSSPIEIEYDDGDELIHYVDDTGEILHNPNYPDPDCPCYDDDGQGDTSSQLAAAMSAYQRDFYSITTVGNNTGGTSLDRLVAQRVLALVAW